MKSASIFCFTLVLLLIGFNQSLKAQDLLTDSLVFFQQPLELASGGKFILGDGGLGYRLQPQSIMKAAPVSYVKKVKIPSASKLSDQAIILKNKNGCFEFSCADGCTDCKLVWYDRNGDGVVQPRQELRCITPKGRVGKISLRKVSCK